jgi:hypothetical protein
VAPASRAAQGSLKTCAGLSAEQLSAEQLLRDIAKQAGVLGAELTLRSQVIDDLRQQLREIERGESAPWIAEPPAPAARTAGMALACGALVLIATRVDPPLQGPAQLVVLAGILLTRLRERRRRGTEPAGPMPRELRGGHRAMLLAVVALNLAALVVGEQVSALPGVALALVGTFAVLTAHQRHCAAAVARLRHRLA